MLQHHAIMLIYAHLYITRNDSSAKLWYQRGIHIYFEHIVLFLRNMFKFRGNTKSLEICATSKEIMFFHGHGFR
jgi:hypothetical protein